MNINSFSINLLIEKQKHQQQQLLRFMEIHKIFFDSHALCIFSQSRFVMGQLLIGMKPTNTNNKNILKKIFEEFLGDCLRKFGRLISSQFMLRGRSQLINYNHITQFQSAISLQQQFISIPHYGLAVILGNTSAIAEMVYRLSKITMYDKYGMIDNKSPLKVISLIEYGISRKCPDCLAVMAYFLKVGLGAVVPVDQQRAFKLAGESSEAGSVIGWFVLASLLKDNSDNASYHNEFDDEINVDETDLGVWQFVGERATRDEQICRRLEKHGCENCFDQFYSGTNECRDCGLKIDVFDDDDTSVSKQEQMRISVVIYYKILSENPLSHPICVDSRKNLVKIYKARERLFGGSIEATDKEIHRLEAI